MCCVNSLITVWGKSIIVCGDGAMGDAQEVNPGVQMMDILVVYIDWDAQKKCTRKLDIHRLGSWGSNPKGGELKANELPHPTPCWALWQGRSERRVVLFKKIPFPGFYFPINDSPHTAMSWSIPFLPHQCRSSDIDEARASGGLSNCATPKFGCPLLLTFCSKSLLWHLLWQPRCSCGAQCGGTGCTFLNLHLLEPEMFPWNRIYKVRLLSKREVWYILLLRQGPPAHEVNWGSHLKWCNTKRQYPWRYHSFSIISSGEEKWW